MTTLILKALQLNGKLDLFQIMDEMAKFDILADETYMESLLRRLESQQRIKKLETGEYIIYNGPPVIH